MNERGSSLVQALGDFHFLRPWWLLALLVLPVLWWLWRLTQQRANAWRGLVDAHLLAHLQVGGGRRQRLTLVGCLLAWSLGALAMAGPTWRQAEQPLWQTRAPLVIALDLSGSINANDLPPSRLLQARAKLATLLRERAGGQVGLVAYAGQPFTVAPLTDDAANVALFLDALQPGIMPVPGNDARQAIAWSQGLLRQAGFDQGQILLLTDHVDDNAEASARSAAARGYSVSVMGLGTADGAAYRDADGQIGRARLDADSLQRLAAAGAGRYTPLTSDDRDLKLLGVLDPQSEDARAAHGEKGTSWLDQGYWVLPPLMLLCLLAFRRGGVLAVLALCAVLPMAFPAGAVDWWQRADQKAQARIEQGAQAYRRGDFEAAESKFRGLQTADGLYNRGNALAKQGRYDEAIAAYDAALKQQPGMEDAIANRAAVEAARKRQQQSSGGQGGQGGKGGQKPPPQGQDQQQDGKQGADKTGAQDRSEGNSKQQDPKGGEQDGKQGDPQEEPAKSEAQRQQEQQSADAAQRQRMEQAMQQGQGEQDADKAAQANGKQETPAERERRQATEAWLRRVPDDPGGLLKAKFQLEYERRQREGQ